MSFWKSLLRDLLYISIYIIFYHILGFELTVIMALAQILSDLSKMMIKKSESPKQMYVQQKSFPKKIKF